MQNRPNLPHGQAPRVPGAGGPGGKGSNGTGSNTGWPFDGSGNSNGYNGNAYPGEPAPLPPQPAARPPKRRKHRARRFLATIAVLLVVVVAATAGYAVYSYQRFVSGVTHVEAIAASAFADIDGDDQNILLVGDDHRPADSTPQELAQMGTGLDGGSTSTDTMMVLHLPADGSAATLVSLPRDSWVDIDGYGTNKLNAAFAFGSSEGDAATGAQLLISTVQNVTGLRIDHYVRVSMLGFYNLVDALGPVDVCLNNAVDDPYSTLSLPAGVSTLNAQQALAFVRQRHGLPNGDLDRQVRQQYFLSVEARTIASPATLLNPGRLTNVLDAASSAIETDPDLNFIDIGLKLQRVGADDLASATVPIAGTPLIWSGGNQVSIVELDTATMPSFIAAIVGQSDDYTASTASMPADVAVSVLNGSGVSGAAAETTETLAGMGFVTGAAASTDDRTVSTIEYPPGMESAAKAVAAALPGATVSASAFVDGVTVVIGANGLEVPIEAPAAGSGTTASGDDAVVVPEAEPESGTDEGAGTTSYAAGACIN
ncbi:LCP family protein [Glaciihabitans tibetensis]|uniref:LCP family protein n=1 Tax=Glaciihabitans tibetensis TaxID=1266600 RepID=UPI001FE355B5|nr:LCP family protein [Glaciihabitans tibetensis]